MQDRYTGDLGDFGKYGLLRALCHSDDKPSLRLGMVWYLVPSESHNEDGKHINYLKDPRMRLRECDPALYDELRNLFSDGGNKVVSESRRVATVESSGLLPHHSTFYGRVLSYSNGMCIADRARKRDAWLEGALDKTSSSELVFLDPDNGIEC